MSQGSRKAAPNLTHLMEAGLKPGPLRKGLLGMWSFGKPYNHSAVEARLAHRPGFDGKEGAESLPAEEFSLWMCGFAAGVSRMSYHFSACLAPTSPRQDVLSMGMNAVRRGNITV